MTYTECRDCGFWVTPGDDHCPNCGITRPHADRKTVAEAERAALNAEAAGDVGGSLGMISGAVGGAIVGWTVGGMFDPVLVMIPCVVAGTLTGSAYGWTWGAALGSRFAARRRDRFQSRAAGHLREFEALIDRRLEELEIRERQLHDCRERVQREPPDEQWTALIGALDGAASMVRRQRHRYVAKSWEIGLARWQNALQPLAADRDRLSHTDFNRHLWTLQSRRKEAEALLGAWRGGETAATPEGEECIRRLTEALAACEHLRQGLVAEQALAALRGVLPADDPLPSVAALAEARAQMSQLSARSELGEFSQAFRKLEAEYGRFAATQELDRAVEPAQWA